MSGGCGDDLDVVGFEKVEYFLALDDGGGVVADDFSWYVEFGEGALEAFDDGVVLLILDGYGDEEVGEEIQDVEGGGHLFSFVCLFLLKDHEVDLPGVVWNIRDWNSSFRDDALIGDSMKSASSAGGANELDKALG